MALGCFWVCMVFWAFVLRILQFVHKKLGFDLKRGVIERDQVFVERGSLENDFRVRKSKWENLFV